MLPENTILQGRYQILEPIGRGGMGAVYKALDMRLRSVVALKETLLSGEVVRKAFEREAQLLAGLRHPALPKVSDHFTAAEGQFLVMEFIPGADLGKLMQQHEGPFASTDVLRWADALLDALEYLHSHAPPIVHRDIKPQNMKLTDRGEIILLDFGLAKGAAAQATRSMTTSSIFGYTPHYAPLEQIQGTGTDPRSDLYALAATLYHLLTAAPPPDALTRAAAKINEEADPLLPANQLNPEVSEPLAGVLARAMAQKPDQRYPSAAALRTALRATAQGIASTEPLSASTAKLADPAAALVRVASAETVAARATPALVAGGSSATEVHPSTGTTMTPASSAPAARSGARWLWPVVGVLALALIGAAAMVAGGGMSAQAPTANPNTAVVFAIVADTETPSSLPAATSASLSNAQILETAVVLQTAEAQQRIDELATARVLVNATDGAETQTSVALTPTATALPATEPPAATSVPDATATASPAEAAPTTAPRPTAAPAPTTAPRPTAAPAPTSPPPSPTPDKPDAVIVDSGAGRLFRGSANLGEIDPARGNGGSCIEGRVTQVDGTPFGRLGVQVDYRGDTRQPAVSAEGTYGLCGLGAGEWGISIYQAGGIDIPGNEQVAHQVRVQLTGTPGEIVYVNFRATESFVLPTSVPTAPPSPYNGVWRGTNSGTTTTGSYPPGRFEIEVRDGAIYRISVDGPSCPFETYPSHPSGIPIGGNAFRISGAVFNPITGANNALVVTVSGSFASERQASGTLSADLNGAQCASGSWNAQK